MKTKLICLSGVLLLTGLSGAATINTGNVTAVGAGSRILVDSSNNTLISGYAAIGYFTSLTAPGFATSTGLDLQNDFNVLGDSISSFQVDFLSSGNIIPGGFEFSGSATTDGTTNTDFVGKLAYVVIGNAATLAASTEAFIYATGQAIPSDPSTGITVDLSAPVLAGTIEFGTGSGTGDVFVGATNTGTVTNALQTATLVPEPSTLLLSAFGVLGLLRRKR